MKRIARSCAGLALVLVLAGCFYSYRLELTETRSWPASGISAITATTANGDVAVTATSDTVVSAGIKRTGWGIDREDAESALTDLKVEDDIDAGRLTLEAEIPPFSNRGFGVAYDLSAPAGTGLKLNTSNGKLNLTGMTGGGEATTSNGDLQLSNTAGEFRVGSSNGEVVVSNHRGSLRAQTSNGRIEANFAVLESGNTVELRTSNGRVTAYLPSGVSCEFDAVTSNGHVSIIDFAAILTLDETEHKTGRIGSGTPAHLTISTSNGDIEIRAR